MMKVELEVSFDGFVKDDEFKKPKLDDEAHPKFSTRVHWTILNLIRRQV